MARVAFPDRVDAFHFSQTREERNLYATDEKVTMLDVLYMIHELEKAYFTVTGATSATAATDTTSATIASLSAQVAALESQVAALSGAGYLHGSGAPSAVLGANGADYYDDTGLTWYKKLGGVWIQQS